MEALELSATTQEAREQYGETTQFQIISRYLRIMDALSDARTLLYQTIRRPNPQALVELDLLLADTESRIELLTDSLFTAEDKVKVKPFKICLTEAKTREVRMLYRSQEGRLNSNYRTRLAIEDRYVALRIQWESVRDIAATRKWFDLSRRPDPRRHSTDLDYEKKQ